MKTMKHVATTDQGEVWQLDPPHLDEGGRLYVAYLIYPANDQLGHCYVLDVLHGCPAPIRFNPLERGYVAEP